MGRKATVNLNLPKGVRARPKAGGIIYYYLDTGGRPRREIPLGSVYVAAVKKWAELTQANSKPAVMFKDVTDRYIREILPRKAPRTQADNIREIETLLQFFNDPPIEFEAIEPKHVRLFMDWRGQTGKVRANREKALLSHIWNYAREVGITSLPNPCRGVKGFTETGRTIYVESDILAIVYSHASQPLKDAMDLAYMTAQRPADVLKMSETDHRDGSLRVRQGKTDKALRVSTIDAAGEPNELGQLLARLAKDKAQRLASAKASRKVKDLAIVCGANGMRMTASALDNAFDRAREKAATAQPDLADAIRAFQFRDLRAKAGTDKADSSSLMEAQRQLGHASVKMTEHYVRLGTKVTPTRGG